MTNLQHFFRPANLWLGRHQSSVIKVSIILTVLFAGAYIAPRFASGGRLASILVMAYAGLVVTIIFLRWPGLGLLLTMVGGMFVPFVGPSGLNVAVVGIGFLMFLWLLDMLVRKRKIEFVSSRTMLPAFIFILVSLLAFGIGQFPWYPLGSQAPLNAQLGGLAIFALSMGAFLLVANTVRDMRWLQALTWTFIILGGVYIVGRVIPSFRSILDRIYLPGFTAGSLFWVWIVALPFAQAVFNRRLHPFLRVLLSILVLAAFYDGIIQAYDWKSGWIPPLVAVAAIIAVQYWRRIWILLPLSFIPAYDLATQSIGSDAYSWGTRLDAWRIVLEIVRAEPILGLGFGNYRFYTTLIPIRGYYNVQFNSHSQYIDILAQTGLLGLGALLWFFWEVGRLGWWLRERVPEGFARAYVYGALGGLAGTLFAAFLVDWVLPFVYNIGLTGFRASILAWLFLGGLVSLERLVKEPEKS